MARNRKRAKERRANRPQRPPSRRGGAGLGANGHADHEPQLPAPEPPTPGSPAPDSPAHERHAPEPPAPGELRFDAEGSFGAEGHEPQLPADDVPAPHRHAGPGDGEDAPQQQPSHPAARAPADHRAGPGPRLVNFVQGSWRELQRVQWPDRRQVMQATSVVIGFVVVAGVFLGVSDWLAGKLVNFILK